jgi:hypothetical protein
LSKENVNGHCQIADSKQGNTTLFSIKDFVKVKTRKIEQLSHQSTVTLFKRKIVAGRLTKSNPNSFCVNKFA